MDKGDENAKNQKEKIVESERYLLTVLRYILQNPVKAGIKKKAQDYGWSSYSAFINKEDKSNLIQKELIKEYFTDETYIEYMNERNDEICLEYNPKIRYTDEQLYNKISKIIGLPQIERITASVDNIEEIIMKIKKETDVSGRQLSRVINVSRWKIEQVKE